MAVRIPVYNQQTSTPNARLAGGQLTTDVGPNIGGALQDLARGVAVMGQRREEEQEDIAAAWAADSLATIQREAPRKLDELKQTAGEGGAGVVDGINGWMEERTTALLESAPTEKSRAYLRGRLQEYGTRLDLGAYDYQQAEQVSYIDRKYTDSIDSGAAAAAANPGMAPTIIAEIRTALQANTVLSPEQKRAKEEVLIQTVSYADVLGELERDPYRARTYLRSRIGLAADANTNDVQLQMEGAMGALEKLEAEEGFTVPADMRQEAITSLMAGGTIGVRDGEVVMSRKGGESGGNVPMTYGALEVPRVIELLSRADAEIARRENEQKQNADFGKLLFQQELNDKKAALANGEPASLPSFATAAMYLGEERAMLEMRELQVAQTLQGEIAGMDGMSNEALAAVIASPPTGTDNRQFRDTAYRIKAQRISAIMAARKDDPGGYVLSTSAPVQGAYARLTAEQERVAGLGPAATPQDAVALQRAQTQYVEASTQEQRRLGVLDPKLPKAYVGAVVRRFNDGMTGDQAPQAAAELEGLAMNLLDAPDAIVQVQKETGLAGALAIDGVPGMVIKRVQNMAALPEAKVKELLPAGVVWGDVEREVANAFMPLDATFAAQGDVNTASRYRTAGHLLAADFLHSGKAATAAQAAQMSYEKLFSERQVAKRTYRVPLSLPSQGRVIPIDPDAVETGLDSFINNITPEMMQFPVDPGFTAEESFARNIRTVKSRAYWANNQTGTGVILMGPDGAQKRPDGKPIEVSFEQAVRLGAGEDAIRAATEKKAALETSPYSGLR